MTPNVFRALALALPALLTQPSGAATPSARDLDRAPMLVLDAVAVRRAVAAIPPDTNHGPLRIAATVPVSAGLDAGAWSTDGADSVWRLRLYSSGARLLIAHFDVLALPEGAQLRFMSPDGRIVHGPYFDGDGRKHRGLWTPMIRGEEAVIELRVPAARRDAVRLHIAQVAHGIVDPLSKADVEPKSGSCNIDVVCSQGNDWRNQIRSVVKLQVPAGIGFVSLCTGSLVNNVRQDGRPYILTAHHCGATASNADGIVAYWNFQTSSCNGTPNGSESQAQSGATLRGDNATADYTLVEMDTTPLPAYDAYYSGFNVSTTATPASGAGIHHPNGDEKRISLYDTAASRATTTLEGNTIQAWKVFWSQGVTEQGSSGSGLWNQDKQIVGVLSGGASSCANPAGADFYGRLDVAWTNGLKTYLDPDNSGRTSFCGKNSGATCVPGDTGGGGSDGGGGGGGAFGLASIGLLLGLGILQRRRRIAKR